jgi:hypothetical protein
MKKARLTQAAITKHLDCFFRLIRWLDAEESKCAAQIERIADAHEAKGGTGTAQLPDWLVNRWIEIQIRRKQGRREAQRFMRRHGIPTHWKVK